MLESSKRPRHYAAEIADLPTKKERVEAFKQVPTVYKSLVREHLKTINMWRTFKS